MDIQISNEAIQTLQEALTRVTEASDRLNEAMDEGKERCVQQLEEAKNALKEKLLLTDEQGQQINKEIFKPLIRDPIVQGRTHVLEILLQIIYEVEDSADTNATQSRFNELLTACKDGTNDDSFKTLIRKIEQEIRGTFEELMPTNNRDGQTLEELIASSTMLLDVTLRGNNFLHLAVMLRNLELAQRIGAADRSLFFGFNVHGESPLTAAIKAADTSFISKFIKIIRQSNQNPNSRTTTNEVVSIGLGNIQFDSNELGLVKNMLLKTDKHVDNALHHAIRNGFENLAVDLLKIESRLSERENFIKESPMYMAARKGYDKIVDQLFKDENSSPKLSGPNDSSALHAAVNAGHTGIIDKLLEKRPTLARKKDGDGYTPLACAVSNNNIKIVKSLLKKDPSVAYIANEQTGATPFHVAAVSGFVLVAKEIIKCCPDCAYIINKKYSANALHQALEEDRQDFVDFIVQTPELHRLVNEAQGDGDLPLHNAARLCKSNILRSLISYKRQDYTAVNSYNHNAVDIVSENNDLLKTLKWNESFNLVSDVIPSLAKKQAQDEENKKKENSDLKKLSERQAANTALVAALLATITFAAAFTVPGGFSSSHDEGQPVFQRMAAFHAFLISDTIAMCSSLAVAFFCILTPWSDFDYLLDYKKITTLFMWCAYLSTIVAFGTGMYTVMSHEKKKQIAIPILLFRRTTQESQPSNPSPSERQTNVTGNEPQHNITAVNEPQRSADDERQPIADNNV